MNTTKTTACAVALGCSALLAAQSPAAPGADPAAATDPQLSYRSAFADYQPYQDVPLADWHRVNAVVGDAAGSAGSAGSGGSAGHAGHGSDDTAATPAADAAPPAGDTQAPPPPRHHHGHGGHGGAR
jgi:hypothetical protein